MPTYAVLTRWTQKGLEKLKDAPSRLEGAKKTIESAGGKLVSYYLTMGRYDAIAIVEFPNDETFARTALAGLSDGFIRTETLRAFNLDEYQRIMSPLA